MPRSKLVFRSVVALIALAATATLADAAELKIFAPCAIETVLDKIGPTFPAVHELVATRGCPKQVEA